MCCLFGLIDTRLRFTGKQKSKMLHALATVSEVRGTDATGIAYHTGEQLCIYKRPIPATSSSSTCGTIHGSVWAIPA